MSKGNMIHLITQDDKKEYTGKYNRNIEIMRSIDFLYNKFQ